MYVYILLVRCRDLEQQILTHQRIEDEIKAEMKQMEKEKNDWLFRFEV